MTEEEHDPEDGTEDDGFFDVPDADFSTSPHPVVDGHDSTSAGLTADEPVDLTEHSDAAPVERAAQQHGEPDGPTALPRPLAVVEMDAAVRAEFLRALAGPDGTVPADISVLRREHLAVTTSRADAEMLAGAAVDVRQRELDAATATEEGAGAAARAARNTAEAAAAAHATTMQQVRATSAALDSLREELARLEADAGGLRGTVADAARRGDLLDGLAEDAARAREDLRHRAAVAILTLEVELGEERTARTAVGPDDDPGVQAARARHAAAADVLSQYEAAFGPTSLDATAREEIESTHAELERLAGKRRAEAARNEAEARLTDLLGRHGYASYLDYTIGNATLDFGSLAAGGIEQARADERQSALSVEASIDAFHARSDALVRRAAELDERAAELAGATSGEQLAALLARLPAVTGDPAAWSEYARRTAAGVRAANGDTERLAQVDAEIDAVERGIADLEHFADLARSAVATAEIHLVGLWASVETEETTLRSASGFRLAAAAAVDDAVENLRRRQSGEIDEADDLCETVLAQVSPDLRSSVVLDDALGALPAPLAAHVLDLLRRRRPDGDLLCLTTDADLLDWAADQGLRGHIEPWWEPQGSVPAATDEAGEA